MRQKILAGLLAIAYVAASGHADTLAPTMDLNNPLSGETVSGNSVQVLGWAMDASGVTTVNYQLDGAPLPVFNRDDHWAWPAVCAAVSIADPNCPNVGYTAFFDSTQFSGWGAELIGKKFGLDRQEIRWSAHQWRLNR